MKRKNTLLDLQRDIERIRYPFRRRYSLFDPNPRLRVKTGPRQYITRSLTDQERANRESLQAAFLRRHRNNIQRYVRNRRVINHVKKLGMISRGFKRKYPNSAGAITDAMRLVGQYAGLIK